MNNCQTMNHIILSNILTYIGIVHRLMEKYDIALEYFEKAMKHIKESSPIDTNKLNNIRCEISLTHMS